MALNLSAAGQLMSRLNQLGEELGLGALFTPHNMPAIEVVINGKDRTVDLCTRFISLSLNDVSGFEADSLTLVLDDTDGAMALPAADEKIELAIGWVHTGLVDKGTFTIDDVEHSGPPDTITITARSAEFCGPFTEKKERSFNKTTIGAIVKTIAAEHGWQAIVDDKLAAVPIDHIDQQGESNANLLTRLASEHDAVATVKAGHLLFIPDGTAKTATGKDIPPLIIHRSMTSNHRFNKSRGEQYTGVIANYHDKKEGKRKRTEVKRKPAKKPTVPTKAGRSENGVPEIIVGRKDNVYTLPHTYASKATAERAAIAKWQKLQRAGACLSLSLPYGMADLIPLQPITVEGFKKDIDAVKWSAKQISHDLSAGGYTSNVDCECVQVEKDQCTVE